MISRGFSVLGVVVGLSGLAVAGLGSGCGSSSDVASAGAGGEDGGGADGNGGISGEAADYSLGIVAIPDVPAIMQGKDAKVAITLRRGALLTSPVTISAAGLPESVVVAPVTTSGASAEITITVPINAVQGVLAGTINASAPRPDNANVLVKASAPVKSFVRGAPGAIDTTWAAAGSVDNLFKTSVTAQPAKIVEVLVAADDSLYVVANRSLGATVVAHVDASGTVDTAYGDGGVAVLPGVLTRAAALQPDGKVVVGGGAGPGQVGRILATGQPDTAFAIGSGGSGGVATMYTGTLNGQNAGVVGVALRANGDIYLAFDNTGTAPGTKAGILRLDKNGALVPTYGDGGGARRVVGESIGFLVRSDPKSASFGSTAMVAVNGGFAFSQLNGENSANDPAVGETRIYDNRDPGGTGLNRIGAGNIGLVESADGAIVAPLPRDGSYFLAKFDATGALVNAFGATGVAGPFPNNATGNLNGFAGQADGKLLLTKSETTSAGEALRFTDAGALDESFGAGGHVTVGSRAIVKLGVQKTGRIVLGTITTAAPVDSGLTAFWP